MSSLFSSHISANIYKMLISPSLILTEKRRKGVAKKKAEDRDYMLGIIFENNLYQNYFVIMSEIEG
jgi:hypothetical protein